MVENRPAFPAAPIDEKTANFLIFHLKHLGDSLEEIKRGAVFTGKPLEYLRESNRFCMRLNAGVVLAETIAAARLAGRDKLSRATAVLILGHAALQVKRGVEKFAMQRKFNSNHSICWEDISS